MRIARFLADQGISYGVVEGDTVHEISLPPFVAIHYSGRSFPLAGLKILAPCLPSKIFALAFNYNEHLSVGQIGVKEPPKEPQIFLKVPSAIAGPGDPIVLPRDAGKVDEEAELVVVMGKRCRNAKRRDALKYVFGYTCGNDVSAREWQKKDLSWWRAKSSDTFAPIGPYIVTDLNGGDAKVTGLINGKEVQKYSTRDLIFDIPAMIEWISSAVTLEPGDLIFTGTSQTPMEIHAGDMAEVEIEGIGVLANPVA